MARNDETEAYLNLVNDGGRPLYPIAGLDPVSADPDRFAELLLPWQNAPDVKWAWETPWGQQKGWEDLRKWEVFQRQWKRWQVFRRWQNDNRGLRDDYGGLPAYIESRKSGQKRCRSETEYASWLEYIETDTSRFDLEWEREQKQREMLRNHNKEHGCSGLAEYSEAVRRRLAQHGFNRAFSLKEDPRRQGELETWIEYLNFEYWWLDKFTGSIRRLEPSRNKAWQELVDSHVLWPDETDEYIRTDACARQRQAAMSQQREAVEVARSECARVHNLTQEDPRRVEIPKSKRIQMLRTASASFHAAEARLKWLHERNELIVGFIRGTFAYEGAKRDASRQRKLVSWVSDQVSLIEAASGRVRAADARSGSKRCYRPARVANKRKPPLRADGTPGGQKRPQHTRDVSLVEAEVSETRMESYHHAHSDIELHIDADEALRREGPKPLARQHPLRRSSRITDDCPVASRESRRSARIAARQDRQQIPATPRPRPGSRRGQGHGKRPERPPREEEAR